MKKRLEAELISIAHRILKLKNKAEVNQLYIESQKLYEAITVLKFYQDNFEQIKNEISEEEIAQKIETILEEKNQIEEPVTSKPVADFEKEKIAKVELEEQPKIVGEIVLDEDELLEKEEIEKTFEEEQVETMVFELVAETEPQTETQPEITIQEEPTKPQAQQISLEELLGQNYNEPVFVKPNDVTKPIKTEKKIIETSEAIIEETPIADTSQKESKSTILNDKLAKGINIAFNDRIAFVKHLFQDSNEDYNRVLSQLNTFTTFAEAKDFIIEIIKPDYNNWQGKQEFEDRFIEIVEKKFL